LMRSIAYRRNRLVNRKTAIVVKMTLHVGIKIEIKVFVVRTMKFSHKRAYTREPYAVSSKVVFLMTYFMVKYDT
jgi:hypothetical protein